MTPGRSTSWCGPESGTSTPRRSSRTHGPSFATFQGQPRRIAARLSLRDGIYDGPYEAYFTNRKLSAKETYRAGLRHGPYEWYFESGQLFESGTYRDGVLDGPYEAYWESGDLRELGTYRNGRFHGAQRLVQGWSAHRDGHVRRRGADGELRTLR